MKGFFIWVSIPLNIEVQLPRSTKKKTIQIHEKASIIEILNKLHIKPDTCLVLINNNPVPDDTIVRDGEKITIIEVTSGG
jgi:sulfur carrier protein ThiS